MAQAKLLLRPHAGLRPVRAHEGQVITLASNQRWSSDGLDISCWNGEVVRLAFAIYTCDREIIAWQVSTGGVSGEMVRKAFVKTPKRDYARIKPCPDALTVLQQLPAWIEDYNETTHTAACECGHLVSLSAPKRGWRLIPGSDQLQCQAD
jgi:transposase InsO family protein